MVGAERPSVRPELGTLPPRIARLPVDDRGWPIPWFVAYVTNEAGESVPEFRAADREKFVRAIKERRCWVCGEPLGTWLAFPIGPMCSITRTISEPPCHRDCAEWSIQHCPFLANPAMVRRIGDLPPDVEEPPGVGLHRNPGVMCLWMTRTFETFRVDDGRHLLTVGEPSAVTWWCEGRPATRAEVQSSVENGLPNLLALAKTEGAFAVEALGKQVKRAEGLWPA
jgi:hypothetical protein